MAGLGSRQPSCLSSGITQKYTILKTNYQCSSRVRMFRIITKSERSLKWCRTVRMGTVRAGCPPSRSWWSGVGEGFWPSFQCWHFCRVLGWGSPKDPCRHLHLFTGVCVMSHKEPKTSEKSRGITPETQTLATVKILDTSRVHQSCVGLQKTSSSLVRNHHF